MTWEQRWMRRLIKALDLGHYVLSSRLPRGHRADVEAFRRRYGLRPRGQHSRRLPTY